MPIGRVGSPPPRHSPRDSDFGATKERNALFYGTPNRSHPTRALPLLQRSILFAALGTLPGIIWIILGDPRRGIACVALGLALSTLMSQPDVSISRIFRMIFPMMFGKMIPGLAQAAIREEVEAAIARGEDIENDRLQMWLAPPCESPRAWIVLLSAAFGVATGIVFARHELHEIEGGGAGLFLPFPNSRDSMTTQAVLLGIAVTIWFATVGGVVASVRFRRPIILAIAIGSSLALIGNTLGGQPVDRLIGLLVFFTTVITGVAILLTVLCELSPD